MNAIPWTINDILDATDGAFLSGDMDSVFSGISIDSRQILPDHFFVAIKGEHHDGHNFIEDVKTRGVRGIMIQNDNTSKMPLEKWRREGMVCVAVEDTKKALGDLANLRRKQANISVIAITGSNGKTTAKEMTASILRRRFNVLSTFGNLNNEVGLPLTLFRLNRVHEWAVLELGMNHPGEISELAEICMPDIGVITNIGPSHLEGLGSIEAVRDAKGELLGKINPGGTAVLNADDPNVMQLAHIASMKVCLYGQTEPSLIRAQSIINKGCNLSFELLLPSESVTVNLKIPGKFMVSNALAASAVGYLLGLSATDIKTGLEAFKPVKGRMSLLKTGLGINLIDDTYNANPYSVKAAIATLRSLRGTHRTALVLGDMLELGEYAESMHKEVGKIAYRSGVTRLFLTGDHDRDVAAGALTEGMKPENIFIGTQEAILESLSDWMKPRDWILVKGSRSTKMENIVYGLIQKNKHHVQIRQPSNNNEPL